MNDRLKTVFDPEILVNVVDLGLIYVCEAHPLAEDAHRLEIKMSMTAPDGGLGDVLMADAGRKVQGGWPASPRSTSRSSGAGLGREPHVRGRPTAAWHVVKRQR